MAGRHQEPPLTMEQQMMPTVDIQQGYYQPQQQPGEPGPSYYHGGATYSSGSMPPPVGTPLYLINNGVRLNKNNRPDIFRNRKEPQVLSLPSRGGRGPEVLTPVMPSGANDVERIDRIFGAANPQVWKESVSQELGRKEICTVAQLQRALQSKIAQSSRPLEGASQLFQKMDRHRRGHIDFRDLKAAVRDFNLEASDELVGQLLRAIDSDHDGVLSLGEFIAGLKANNREGMRLHTPQTGISSRAYFRTIAFNHPLHNMMHQAPSHFFAAGHQPPQ